MMNLEQSEALAVNLEQAAQDKATLQKRLKDSLVKEGKQKFIVAKSLIIILLFIILLFNCRGTIAQSLQFRGTAETFGA
jgi:membrane-anchored glycerophosphoryl diester phosphodiesterase (GDPDase)